MATVVAGLAATAFTVGGASVTYGGLLTIAALGGLASTVLNQPDIPDAPKVSGVADKTIPQQADQLDAAVLGDEESEKRKRQSAKSKFKIDKDVVDTTPEDTGVALESDKTKVTGVQI